MTAGASLNPDSASSSPATRRGRGTTRSTENTAAASVTDTTAPSSSANCQSIPSSRCAPAAVTTMLTATPTVASTPAGASTRRTSANRVVRPPSIEDDRQCDRAEVVGEQVVVEVQSEAVLADDDADEEEQQQARQADSAGRPRGDDARQQHEPSRPAAPDTAAAKSFHPAVNQYTATAWVSMTLCSESDAGPTSRTRRV